MADCCALTVAAALDNLRHSGFVLHRGACMDPAAFASASARDNKGMDELRCLDDYLKAIQRLMKKHEPGLVLKIARDWLAYMDKAEQILNRGDHSE